MRARVFGAKHATGEVSLLVISYRNVYFIETSSKAGGSKFFATIYIYIILCITMNKCTYG